MKFYGFLSNAHGAALLGPDGSIDWAAFPRFDSPAVFARLLGTEDNGYFRVYPDADGENTQEYMENTNIITTAWETARGRAIIHDYLAIGRSEIRRVIKSEVSMTVEIRPRFHYGLIHCAVTAVDRGAVFRNPLAPEAMVFALNGSPLLASHKITSNLSEGVWHLPPGHYELVMQYIADDKDRLVQAADVLTDQTTSLEEDIEREQMNTSLAQTITYWRHRIAQLPAYKGPHSHAFIRSLLVLDGLTYRTNGAIIAAPTTSLPETIGESRQWDYRFAWVRDGSYAAEALLNAGDQVACRRFLEFLLNCVDLQGKPFQAPFFHVDGSLIRGEHDLDWLAGYQGSVPCREGNAATRQQQLDIEGDFLWTVWRYYLATGDIAFIRFYWHTLKTMVDWVEKNWHQKDASLWEFRDQDAYYTHSQLMCWVALQYGSQLAEAVKEDKTAIRWQTTAKKVRDAIECEGFNTQTGHYVQAFGGDSVDAALLVMPLYGYCRADDPRFLATLKEIESVLVKDFWVYRYSGDMLGAAAHPFVLASFWLARIYILLGRVQEAEHIVESLLKNRTDLGLLGEHADQATGAPRGNFPQGFSHLGLIMTLLDLSRIEVPAPNR